MQIRISLEKIKSNSKIVTIFALKRSYLSFVIFPLVLAAIYLIFISSSRYESTAVLSLNQNQNNPISQLDSFSNVFSSSNSDIDSRSRLLIEYIRSEGMLYNLNKEIGLKAQYQSKSIDFISRLSKYATMQAFLNYYNSMLHIDYDDSANVITIKAQGYSSLETYEMLNQIVHLSQIKVDDISQKLARNRMLFMTEELERIKVKAIRAQQKLIDFQSKKGIVSPESALASKSQVLAELQSKLADSEAELNELRQYLNPKAAEVISREQQIQALKKQIAKEKSDFLGRRVIREGKSDLDNIISSYQWLKLESDLAMKEYGNTLSSFEEAQIDVSRQQMYLIDVMSPTLPDAASYPTVLYDLLIIFVLLSVAYGVAKMIITIILEHR